eukprot:3121593-Amphidinium_carterae.1
MLEGDAVGRTLYVAEGTGCPSDGKVAQEDSQQHASMWASLPPHVNVVKSARHPSSRHSAGKVLDGFAEQLRTRKVTRPAIHEGATFLPL